MEIKVYKDTVTAAQSICDTKLELPIEAEMLIPDYLPQVFKIVKCFVHLVVLQKQVMAGRLTVDGYLRCVLYYQSEADESLCQAEQKLPFTKQVDVKPGDWGTATVLVSGETEYVNCRAVNQRRVDVRGAFALSVTALAEAQSEIITALSGSGIQQRTTALTGSRTVGAQEKLFTAEETITFDAPPEIILSTQCTGAVSETKLIAGKAVLKGEIRAEVVYRTAPGHELIHTVRQIPFNEILEIEGADEGCQCFAVVEPTGCTITAGTGEEEGENTISATALLYAKAYRPVEYLAVSDAFSTECETELTQQQVMLEETADVFTQQVETVTAGRLPDENARIIDVMATTLPMEVIEQDGEAVLRGRVMAHLLCVNALDEIECYDKVCEYTLPHRYQRPAGDVIAQCYPSVSSVTARRVGEETSAAIVLTVRGMVSFRTARTVLADVSCIGPLNREDGDIALRICFAQAGEELFDIAKRYAASPEAIAAANELAGDTVDEARRLLIPSAG